ncbi:MAG: transglycosylase SLT domain-containing protein [bacterium]
MRIRRRNTKLIGIIVICLIIGASIPAVLQYLEHRQLQRVHRALMERALVINGARVRYSNVLNFNQARQNVVSERLNNEDYQETIKQYTKTELSWGDNLTYSELYNWTLWVIDYAKKYNSLYDNVHWRDVALSMAAIFEKETGWVNYSVLDNGLSTGVPSIRFDTARWVAMKLGESFDEVAFQENVEQQIQYATYYYYCMLQEKKDVYLAAGAYNTGPKGIYAENQRTEDYYFDVRGRIAYLADIF